MAEVEEGSPFDPMSDPEERKHILSVLESFRYVNIAVQIQNLVEPNTHKSFRSYRHLSHLNVTHVRRKSFYTLPIQQQELLSKPPFSIPAKLSKMDDLLDGNAELAEAIFVIGFRHYVAPTLDPEWVATIVREEDARAGDQFTVYSTVMDHLGAENTERDLSKARSCLTQFYRDWSSGGATERAKCFDPIVQTLEAEFEKSSSRNPGSSRGDIKVLVPGAGLGRLVYDLVKAGFSAEGNEFSYHEIFASSLALNYTEKVGHFTLAPFVATPNDHASRDSQFRSFSIPDVHPASELSSDDCERMSMAVGDFREIYGGEDNREAFHAVATVFFIDTAPNLIRYIQTISNCLKPGGIWINLGPLHWHHHPGEEGNKKANDELDDPILLELTDEEVVALVQHYGFVIEKHERSGSFGTGYQANSESMLRSVYYPSFWVARKVGNQGVSTW